MECSLGENPLTNNHYVPGIPQISSLGR
eukprot:UN10456